MSDTRQPDWKFVSNLGDASPVEHGGYFLYHDATGVYGYEAELLRLVSDEMDPDADDARWQVYRVCLERFKMVDGIMAPIGYEANWPHPLASYVAWFDESLSDVAETMGLGEKSIREQLCSDKGEDLALAYQSIAEFHGWANLDETPLTLTRAEVEARYVDGEL
jgi:hypothetical protein